MTDKQRARQVAKALEPSVQTVLLAQAMAQVERERIDALYNGILEQTRYYIRKRDAICEQERLTDHSKAWLLSDFDSKHFYGQCEFAIRKAGYTFEQVPEGYCPALMAESLQRDAEHALILAAEEFFPGVTIDKLLCGTADMGGLETLRKFLDLLIGLVVNRPGFKNPLTGKAVA